MKRRDRESMLDSDPHDDLFFGPSDDDDYDGLEDAYAAPADRPRPGPRPANQAGAPTRLESRRRSRNQRKRRIMGVLAILLVIVLGISVWFIGLPIYHYLFPKDYSGNGSGSVIVTVRANENTSQIGQTLTEQEVVGSERAFTDAASGNARVGNIQPGSYKLRRHMAAGRALTLLLNPSSRVNSDTVVTEGATIVDVETRLLAKPCDATATRSSVCGLGLSKAQVTNALTDVKSLGLPTDYLANGRTPVSVEGFLFPATYTFDDKTSVTEALQQMVGKFTDQARSTKFTAKAKALGLTPYDALIIASIAQGEAKYAADMPKVARVILNRLKVKRDLQVDATSAYAAKLKGLDPTKQIYAQTKGPFNTYKHAGLPPTPIGNPGNDAMQGAVNPAAGDWLFYVNKDGAGHLLFTNSEAEFTKAAARCRANNWGCG